MHTAQGPAAVPCVGGPFRGGKQKPVWQIIVLTESLQALLTPSQHSQGPCVSCFLKSINGLEAGDLLRIDGARCSVGVWVS